MFNTSFYGPLPGNAGALAQANANFLGGARTTIPGATPGAVPLLPGEDKKAIEGVYGVPGQFQPPVNAQPRLPLAQGFAGDIGNMAGLNNAQIAGGFPNPLDWFRRAEGARNAADKGQKQSTGNRALDSINAQRIREMQALKEQSLY